MTTTSPKTGHDGALRLFAALVGVTAVLIVLQGVWAGMFIREGQDNTHSWVEVHDWGARAAILVSLIAAVVAVVRLRSRRDLLIGSVALFVLLFVEAYVGGLIGDSPAAETVHFPLALALVGLAVWLPIRSRAARRGTG
ncbi:hypothetical protein [Jatrophihabitans endophyticus]|uniref:hypothetical protein n=1 Tax=Jatrophihabitans endophyticus TaxID=1206085 RepID=UPI001A03992F|nr:hypothetical protein [Jatrophihabitans endophyticus]MBE7187870.1 hypothetical protein [Jatrophihabitans endophyticus]